MKKNTSLKALSAVNVSRKLYNFMITLQEWRNNLREMGVEPPAQAHDLTNNIHDINEKWDTFMAAVLQLPDKVMKTQLWQALKPFTEAWDQILSKY